MQWLSSFNAKSYEFNDVAIVSVKGSDYSIRFWHLREDDAIIIMKNYNLNKKVDHYQKHRAIILNTAKEYYKNNQQRLKKQAMNKYRELSKEEKKKIKREYGRNIYIKICLNKINKD